MLLVVVANGWGRHATAFRAAPSASRKRDSAATTTTAARGAAQVNCAALGEHKLKAGEHGVKPTQWWGGQPNRGSSAERRSACVGTPETR
ncbi:hypothetical protein F0402_02870 [Mycolicibacter arupensis]|uniref:Uncharacterized protein n=1 Tax=Mycolicibacter arupensis TaxID=342002 RepID=A0A5B1MIL6_9MYCO|nr:hypothetical protein F0402_02870 [Mycolicibacter arupensis]TXI59531.1 MAG: hypothetical protein E6Q54_02615 [Mycolicibacter arupensis]